MDARNKDDAEEVGITRDNPQPKCFQKQDPKIQGEATVQKDYMYSNQCPKGLHGAMEAHTNEEVLGRKEEENRNLKNHKLIAVYRDECKEQINGFTGAKYKKFDTQTEAENFINGINGASTSTLTSTVLISSSLKKEEPNAFPVARISPSNTILNDFNVRLTGVETKLSNLIDHVTNAFGDIKRRLNELEAKKTINNQLVQLENKNIEVTAETSGVKKTRKRKAETDIADVLNNSFDEAAAGQNNGTEETPKPKNTDLEKCKLLDEVDGSFGVNRSVVNSNGFLVNPFGAVVVYTDGACSNNGKVNAKAGIGVWFNVNHPLNMHAPVRGRATNNNAEIQAATAAIMQASKAGIRHLHIFTDSQFLINCITTWIFKWKRNNWMTNANHEVKNKIELVELDNCIDQFMDSVVWTYVRGHCGDIGNTSADELARRGAKAYRRS